MITHGIDLGQTNDFTAHAICDTHDGVTHIIWADRYNKLTYAEMMAKSAKYIHDKMGDIYGDATGAASPAAFEILQQIIEGCPCRLTMCKITSGMNIGSSDGYLTVPRGLLIDGLRIGIQNQTVKFPKTLETKQGGIDYKPILMKEMLEFQSEISASGNVIFKHRPDHHDDLLFAVCLAVFGASQNQGLSNGHIRRYK